MYPTVKQRGLLTTMLADHCTLYNAALQERRDGWDAHKRRVRVAGDRFGRVNFSGQSAQLPAIRAADPDMARWSASSQQQTLRRLNKAFAGFFRRVKNGEAPGYPRFKGRGHFDTVDFTNGDGAKWDSRPCSSPTKAKVYLHGIGHVKVRAHRKVQGTVKQVSVTREGNHWYVAISCDDVPEQPLPATGAVVGLDMATGDNGLAWTSDGARLDNPRHLHRGADRLAAAQRNLATKKRGSNRRRKAVARVANLHRKVARARTDHHHKTALALVADHDFIAVEDLKAANMTRRAKPVPDPDTPGQYLPNGGSAKTGLNKSILDAGWGIFLNVLTAKAESAGRTVVKINPAYTSQTCHQCSHRDPTSRAGKTFTCTNCGYVADADVNAARNILRAGLAQLSDAPCAA